MSTNRSEELKKIIRSGFGRSLTDRLLEILHQQPALFSDLVDIFLTDEEPVSRRAAWAVDLYTERYPDLLPPLAEVIACELPRFRHDGMKRHSLRMLARAPLPETHFGKLISLCFDLLLSPAETPAVKVHAMEVLYRASQVEPDLRQELIDSIEWRFREESAGVKNRGEKILKRLYRDCIY